MFSQAPSISFLFLLLILASVSFGQPDTLWTRYYDRAICEEPHDMVSTQDGGLVIGGGIGICGWQTTFWLFKTDSLGNMLWEYTYPDTTLFPARIEDVLLLEDGRILVSGWAYTSIDDNYCDIRMIMTDESGTALWQKVIGIPYEDDIVHDSRYTLDGGFIFTGSQGTWGDENVLLLKTDSLGNVEWQSRFHFNGSDVGYSVHHTSDGGFIIGARTNYPGEGKCCCVLKTNSYGKLEWHSIFDFGLSWVRDIHETADGGFIGIAGVSYSFSTIIFKLDSTGTLLWHSCIDVGQTVKFVETPDGGHVHTGYTGNRFNNEIFLMQTDSLGNLVWETIYENWEYVNVGVYGICSTFDGGYYVASVVQQEPDAGDTWLLRFGECTGFEGEVVLPEGDGLSCSCLPNPFASSITLNYSLQDPSIVNISVYDISGHLVVLQRIPEQSCGEYSFVWIPEETLPVGCYIFMVDACGMRTTKRCIRIR